MKVTAAFLMSFIFVSSFSQTASSLSVFAHNDYAKSNPFYKAYSHQVGFIEADVFLKDGKLLIGHARVDLRDNKTLDSLYLNPLRRSIIKNNGSAYASHRQLTLMIDLKMDSIPLLKVLVETLKNYHELTDCSSLKITITGSMPDPSLWDQYPDFIHFDGRPGITYTQDQLKRVELISDNFNNYSHWNGKMPIPLKTKQSSWE